MKNIHPFIFALVFWEISIAAVLKPDVSLNTFQKDFGGHDPLIGDFNTLRLRFGARIFPAARLGKDGWWFFIGDQSMNIYQAANPYPLNVK